MSIEKLQDELLTINSSIQCELEAEKRGSTRFSRLPGLYAEKSRIERQLAILQEPQDDALALAKRIVDGNIGHDVIAIARAVREAVQRAQGAVPDVSAMARVLSDRSADACNIDRDDNWAMYGQEYIENVQAMLAASTGQEVKP